MPYEIVQGLCTGCGDCQPVCPVGAINEGQSYYIIDAQTCCDCVGFARQPLCKAECPIGGAIRFIDTI